MTNTFIHGYALLIGVGETAYPKWSLPVTVKDIQALQSILTNADLCGYPNNDRHIQLLHDAGATRSAILDGIAWLKTQAAADSQATVVVYYSGHGWLDQSTDRYYLMPHDVEPVDVVNSALPAQDFSDALCQLQAERLLVVIDSCHAEGMIAAKDGHSAIKLPFGLVQKSLPKSLMDALKQGKGRAVFSSSRGEQKSWICPNNTMSIYTYHLIEALQGAGNQPGDTVVRLSNLMSHVSKAVPKSALKLWQEEQTPFFEYATEDFPVALLRGGKGLPAGGWEAVQREASYPHRHAVQATSVRGVNTIGTMSNSPITSGDRNVVQQGNYNIHMGSANGVAIGDNARAVKTEIGGSVYSSPITTTGGDVTTTSQPSRNDTQELFNPILTRVRARPADPDINIVEIIEAVERIRDEVARGQEANLNNLKRWLVSLAQIAPDIWEVVVTTLERPHPGIAEPIHLLAAKERTLE